MGRDISIETLKEVCELLDIDADRLTGFSVKRLPDSRVEVTTTENRGTYKSTGHDPF